VRDQLKLVGFAAVVCLVCSILLAFVSSALGPRQALNKANDIRGKVLEVFGERVKDENGKALISPAEIATIFASRIKGLVLDAKGQLVEGVSVESLTPQQINDRDKTTRLKAFYPVYVYADPETKSKRYAIHVSGKGLWSTIKGFMALEPDLSTISAVVFYEHQETPGLGGEVEKPFFQDRFKGKKWMEDGEVQKFRVTKPGLADDSHSIDGITAATMTCRGVESFLNADYAVYNRYFEKLRVQQ